jgi:hypothetical protein
MMTHTMLLVLLILAHGWRRLGHVNITEHPTAEWTAQHVVEALLWDHAPDRPQPYLQRIVSAASVAYRDRGRNNCPPGVCGNTPLSNGSSEVSAVNAWTMSSSSTSDI